MNKISTLKDYLETHDIWTAIHALKPYSFIDDPELMNMQQSLTHGQRETIPLMYEYPVEVLAKFIIAIHGSKWDKLIAQSSALNIAAGNTQVTSGNETSNTDQIGSNTSTNKVGAFNSDELIDDTGSEMSSTNDTETTINRQSESGQVSHESLLINLSIEDKTNITTVALADVANYLSLRIYS